MHKTTTAPLRLLVLPLLLAWSLIASAPPAAAGDEPVQAGRVAVGQEAPAFSLPGTDGETYALSDLRGEKSLVLIFFRGTW